jgi:hypothetical protein
MLEDASLRNSLAYASACFPMRSHYSWGFAMPAAESRLVCAICGKPVPLTEANKDSNGKAVHEHCIAFKMAFRNLPLPSE